MTKSPQAWSGVFAATLCPFHEDQSLDESGLVEYIAELASVTGLQGLVCNGHTGEVMSLLPRERAQVTRLVVETVHKNNPGMKVASGVMAEGTLEAVEHALQAKEAGANAILLMPPHHWLRFGRKSSTAVTFCHDVADSGGIDIILHQYPAWTKASYSLEEMQDIARHPRVVMIKMGTRDMSRWGHDYESLKQSSPDTTIATCQDECLLPTVLEGADGALIGFAGFAPRLMVEVVQAALEGDFQRAKKAQRMVAPLARLIYAFGEPGCSAHQRMKVARWILGKFPSPHFRRPVNPLPEAEIDRIRRALTELDPIL